MPPEGHDAAALEDAGSDEVLHTVHGAHEEGDVVVDVAEALRRWPLRQHHHRLVERQVLRPERVQSNPTI